MTLKIPNSSAEIRSSAFRVIWEFLSCVAILDEDTLAKRVLKAKSVLDEGSLTREDFLAVNVTNVRAFCLHVRYNDILNVFATGDYEEGMILMSCFLEDCIDHTSCSWA
jgi:hypothetical protein